MSPFNPQQGQDLIQARHFEEWFGLKSPLMEVTMEKKISGKDFKGELVGRDLEQEKENSRKEIKKKKEVTSDCYCM